MHRTKSRKSRGFFVTAIFVTVGTAGVFAQDPDVTGSMGARLARGELADDACPANGLSPDAYAVLVESVSGEGLEPVDVVVAIGFDALRRLVVRDAAEPFSHDVVGVLSTNLSLRLAGLATDTPLAVTGIVPVKVAGPVSKGDLLTTSATPGTRWRAGILPSASGPCSRRRSKRTRGTGPGLYKRSFRSDEAAGQGGPRPRGRRCRLPRERGPGGRA